MELKKNILLKCVKNTTLVGKIYQSVTYYMLNALSNDEIM